MPMTPDNFGDMRRRFRNPAVVPALLPAGLRMGFIGDSITDHGKNSTAPTNAANVYHTHESIGFQLWSGRYSDQRIVMHPQLTSAKSGLNATDLDNVFTPILCAASSMLDMAHVMMGCNSIVQFSTASPTTAQIQAYADGVVATIVSTRDKLKARGVKALLSAILPRTDYTAAQEACRLRVNVGLAALANGVDTWFVDLCPFITTNGDGVNPIPGMFYDSPGVHPGNMGAERLGYGLAQWIKANVAANDNNFLGISSAAWNSGSNPYGNRFINAGFTGTGGTLSGGATGSAPDNMTVAATAGLGAAVSASGGVMTVTGTGTGGGSTVTITGGCTTTGIAAGMFLTAGCILNASGLTGIRSVDFVATIGGVTMYECRLDPTYDASAYYLPASFAATLRTAITRALGAGLTWQIIINSATGSVSTGYTLAISQPFAAQVPPSVMATVDPGVAWKTWRVLVDAGGSNGGTVVGFSEFEGMGYAGTDLTTSLYNNTAASSSGTSSSPVNAIDDSTTTLVRSTTTLGTTAYWYRVSWPTPVDLRSFSLRSENEAGFSSESPTSFHLQYTPDAATTWLNRIDPPAQSGWAQNERRVFAA